MFKTLNVSIDVINNTVDNILKLKFNKIPKDLKYDNFISLLVFLPDLRTILFIKNKLKSNFKEYIERGILSIFELNSTLEVFHIFISLLNKWILLNIIKNFL